jgi:hypothetical protein
VCVPFPTLEGCMANRELALNHTNKSRFSQASLLFGASMCIFTTSHLNSPTTCFKRFGIDIQWVILWSNFKPFVFSVFTRFTNSSTFFRLCGKRAYKDYSIPSMCITKNNLLKTKIGKLVQCATQFSPMRNGATCSFVWIITPN